MSALSWGYYVLGVSALVAVGALGLEAMLRAAGRAGRWAWLLAFALLLALPLLPVLRPAAPAAPPLLDVLALPQV
ncbi:MAG: hypothetical protein FIB01_07820, partial [Gemmatimonadetes bacterium]|nr:hypothetical protein [Gemmatimonadota bacterium]